MSDAPRFTKEALSGPHADALDRAFGAKNSFWKFGPGNLLMPSFFEDIAGQILDATVREDDVWLISYPRTGECEMKAIGIPDEKVLLAESDFNTEFNLSLFLRRLHMDAGNGLADRQRARLRGGAEDHPTAAGPDDRIVHVLRRIHQLHSRIRKLGGDRRELADAPLHQDPSSGRIPAHANEQSQTKDNLRGEAPEGSVRLLLPPLSADAPHGHRLRGVRRALHQRHRAPGRRLRPLPGLLGHARRSERALPHVRGPEEGHQGGDQADRRVHGEAAERRADRQPGGLPERGEHAQESRLQHGPDPRQPDGRELPGEDGQEFHPEGKGGRLEDAHEPGPVEALRRLDSPEDGRDRTQLRLIPRTQPLVHIVNL